MSAHWLSENFNKTLGLPDDAREWLLALWNVTQVFDDMADGARIDRDDLNTAIFDALVNMPANTFFLRNGHVLLPLMAVAILKWHGADQAEQAGLADERSFVWRAGYYDIVLAVVQLCHGQNVAMEAAQTVMNLYGEQYADYQREMSNA